MKFLLTVASFLSHLYCMPVLANSSSKLESALATSATRFSHDTETTYCGGQVVSYKVLKNNSNRIVVSAIMTAQKNQCAQVSLKKCTVTYQKSDSVYSESSFNCKT